MFDRPTDDYLFKSNEHLHEEYIFMKERNFCESNGGWVGGGGSLLIVRPKEIPSWWYHELWDQLSGIDQQTIIPHQLIRKKNFEFEGVVHCWMTSLWTFDFVNFWVEIT